MAQTSSFKINAPRVIHQIIDGEAVIIDFETGAYFSIDPIGSQIWALIENSLSQAEITTQLKEQYHRSMEEIEGAIKPFIEQLLAEGLIRPADNASSARHPLETIYSPIGIDFQAPILEKYTDMQDLLLLDPIHEVDDSGWPMPKPSESA